MARKCKCCGQIILNKWIVLFNIIFILIGSLCISLVLSQAVLNQKGILAMEFGEEGFLTDLPYNIEIMKYQSSMRPLALNLTLDCATDYCRTEKIFNYLAEHLEYATVEKGAIYPPQTILDEGAGDCKNMVVTFCSMMRSVGQNCYWTINEDMTHIAAVVTQKQSDKIMVIDLTLKYWGEFDDPEEYWEMIEK